MSDGQEWFAPRRYGIGAGLPISWQGWLVVVGYVTIVGTAAIAFRANPPVFVAILAPVTAVFLTIAARTTRGGWRWRWGED